MYIICMPTLFRIGNVRIVIHTHDHAPAHVHAIGKDAEAKFRISDMLLMSSYGFDEKTIRNLGKFLTERKERLLEAWNEIHE